MAIIRDRQYGGYWMPDAATAASGEDNYWTFGQVLALVLLALPFVSIFGTLYGMPPAIYP